MCGALSVEGVKSRMSQEIKECNVLFHDSKEIYYIAEDGTIKIGESKQWDYGPGECYIKLCEKSGLCVDFAWYRIFDFVAKYVGKNSSELIEEVEKRGERAKYGRDWRKKQKERYEKWLEYAKENGDIVIGIDKKSIDVFSTGINIFILLNSRYSFQEQCEFIKNHKLECVNFIISELKEAKRKKVLDLIHFCEISRIVVTRRNEVCFTFELKGKIQEILQNENED